MTTRKVDAEILDGLSPDDPRARRSRGDLRRINGLMGNDRVVAGLLRPHRPRRLLEIGAGDGAFMLRVARRLRSATSSGSTGAGPLPGGFAPRLPSGDPFGVESSATLLDRQALQVPHGYADLGWRCEAVAADAFDYLAHPRTEPFDAVVANLFLHHFEDERLADLLRLVASRTDLFVACEPRRSGLALAGTRFLGAIGCNDVTRHDARVSVRAGFRDDEITRLWPPSGWHVEERSSPPFGHAFRAVRVR